MKKIYPVVCLIISTGFCVADVKFAGIFSDNMVLQQQTNAPIWGWTEPNERVTLDCSWQNSKVEAKADDQGLWRAVVTTPKAGGPYVVKAKAEQGGSAELKNVLVGEVWLCTGQSNMQWKMRGFGLKHWADEVKQADYPEIRLCTTPQEFALSPESDLKANWQVCSPRSVLSFSAVGYFFGSKLHQDLDVPIGLVSVNLGGSSAETWIREETLRKDFPEFNQVLDTYPGLKSQYSNRFSTKQKPPKIGNTSPAVLYNAMIAPIVPMAMRGVIWYQGESNVKKPKQYRTLFPRLIQDWRSQWGQGDFPFYYVQIAPFHYRIEKKPVALLREAQLMALKEPNTGMVVTMDVGDSNNIHPKKKKPVGERLALVALAKSYGKQAIVYSGPEYKEMKVSRSEVWLKFDHVAGGLKSRDGKPLTHFTIAGKDRRFVQATATIRNDKIVVSSPDVSNPEAVRFAWGNDDQPNLGNQEGLPASSFRTDSW